MNNNQRNKQQAQQRQRQPAVGFATKNHCA
jgi:hypothetical protein